jgi:predicted enzyme related to lactoylglutathione lyase
MSNIRYAHVNIVAGDWKNLMKFYVEVFDCEPVSSERNHHGNYAEDLTGLPGVRIVGQHLRVPGHGKNGPTIEIFSFDPQLPSPDRLINRPGFGHLAFEVDDFEGVRQKVKDWGGSDYGEKVAVDIPGAGHLTLLYMHDPEGNIVELQDWHN